MTLAGRLAAGEAEQLELIGEFDARQAWAGPGLLSCAHWLTWRTGMSPNAARERVRIARSLPALPLIAGAFGSGRLSSRRQLRAETGQPRTAPSCRPRWRRCRPIGTGSAQPSRPSRPPLPRTRLRTPWSGRSVRQLLAWPTGPRRCSRNWTPDRTPCLRSPRPRIAPRVRAFPRKRRGRSRRRCPRRCWSCPAPHSTLQLPGCTRRRNLHAHHVTWWALGGPTDLGKSRTS